MMGGNVKILDKKFSPIVGLMGSITLISFDDAYEDGFVEYQGNEFQFELGAFPNLGFSYEVTDELLVTAGLGWNLGFFGTANSQNYAKTFVGLQYYP